jgi:hypothetical protein
MLAFTMASCVFIYLEDHIQRINVNRTIKAFALEKWSGLTERSRKEAEEGKHILR